MARGRIISKSWSTSRKRAAIYRTAGALAEFCLQLFPLLVVHSDDYGRFDGDAEIVKQCCDPGSPRTYAEFDTALARLAAVGLIQRYVVEGTPWIQIVKFDDHQPGMLSKRTKPLSPAPPPHTEIPGNFLLVPENSGLTELKGTEQKGKEKKLREEVHRGSTSDPPPAEALVDLWNELVTDPIPKVMATRLSADRRAKFNARLKAIPDLARWRTVISWLNGQAWCRAPGTGDHPTWTATLDWLCKSDGNVQKYLEKATTAAGRPALVSDTTIRNMANDEETLKLIRGLR